MGNKFGLQDERQGNVSFERLKEIKHRIAKIDESVQSHEVLLRTASVLSSAIETLDIYIPEEATREKSENKELNIKNQIALDAFNSLDLRKSEFLEMLDRIASFCHQQAQKIISIDTDSRIKSKSEQEAQIRAFNQEAIERFKAAEILRAAILDNLYNDNINNIRRINDAIKNIDEQINSINQNIAEIKQHATQAYQDEIRDIKVGDNYLFEGKSDDEINKITKELFDVNFGIDKEIENREIKKRDLKEQYGSNQEGRSHPMPHLAWKTSSEFRQCEKLDSEIKELKTGRANKVNKVLEDNNIFVAEEHKEQIALDTHTDTVLQAAKAVVKEEHKVVALVEAKEEFKDEKKAELQQHKTLSESQAEVNDNFMEGISQSELDFGMGDDFGFDFDFEDDPEPEPQGKSSFKR
tara:strand:- start:8386 stop:9615 length:1230 start_codon:yes stop_codon:yes gene_type:complete